MDKDMNKNEGNKTHVLLAYEFISYGPFLLIYSPSPPPHRPAVMSNTVDMTRVEKYFSQLVRADKLSQLDSRSWRVENASH